MATENDNLQINTFAKGMQCDLADSVIGDDSYKLARNLRYITDEDYNSGELHMIQGALKALDLKYKVLASTSIRQYGVYIQKESDSIWSVYRFTNPYYGSEGSKQFKPIDPKSTICVFRSTNKDNMISSNKLSLVTRYEDENNIKLYIADGKHEILSINIMDTYVENTINKIKSYPFILFKKPVFCGLISGNLKAGLIQYSYQLYNEHGNQSEISPATNLIPLYDGNINISSNQSVLGYEQGSTTDKGVKLKIDVSDYKNDFTNILIYRITYHELGQQPTIEQIINKKIGADDSLYVYDYGQQANSTLTVEEYNSISGIHIIPAVIESKNDYLFASAINTKDEYYLDDKLKQSGYDTRAFQFNAGGYAEVFDYNTNTSHKYTLQQIQNGEVPSDADCFNKFNDMSSSSIITGQSCVFTSDATYYGGTGKNISWKFVVTSIVIDGSSATSGQIGSNVPKITHINNKKIANNEIQAYNIKYDRSTGATDFVPSDAKVSNVVDGFIESNTYSNPYVSYMFKSLRRDELYRYGIVFRDKDGNTSSVKWIADIRVPNMYVPGFEIFKSRDSLNNNESYDLSARPIGVQFEVKNIPDYISSYEIVRVGRTSNDIATITQGVLSRPVRRYIDQSMPAYSSSKYPLTPTGWLTTATYFSGNDTKFDYTEDSEYNFGYKSMNSKVTRSKRVSGGFTTVTSFDGNYNTYQFVSPEICYQNQSIRSLFDKTSVTIHPQMYLFGNNSNTVNATIGTNNDFIFFGANWFTKMQIASISNANNINKIYSSSVNDSSIITVYEDQKHPDSYFYDNIIRNDSRFENGKLTGPRRSGVGGYDFISNYFESYIDTASRYQYVKLYEQAPGTNNGLDLKNNTYKYKINDIAYPDVIKWSEVTSDSTDSSNKTNTQMSYQDKMTSIGTDNYCNFVIKGLYNIPYNEQSGTLYFNHDEHMGDYNTESGGVNIGPGGRCMLINVEENLLYTTSYARSDSRLNRIDYNPSGSNSKYNKNSLINRNSIMGTYLCNIRKSVLPYNGYDKTSRETNIYYSYGNYYTTNYGVDNSTIIFDGDCFIQPFEYIAKHKWYSPRIKYGRNGCTVYSIPVETNINLAYSYGYEFSKNSSKGDVTNIQVDAANVNNKFIQQKDLYVYNSAYSVSQNLTRIAAESDTDDAELSNTDYRTYHSNLKTNDEQNDSWLKFMPANYIDVDTRYGAITGLKNFNNRLVFWQEGAAGILSVNERSAITDMQGSTLILGSGGVLDRYDYIATSNGMHKNQLSYAQSDTTLYWWDYDKHELCMYGGENTSTVLSKIKHVQNIFNTAHSKGMLIPQPVLVFDKKFNELISNVTSLTDDYKGSIVYSEIQEAFTGMYDISTISYSQFTDRVYLFSSDGIYEWNQYNKDRGVFGFNEYPLFPYLKYTVNKNQTYTKVYDNVEFAGRIYGGNKPELSYIQFKFQTPLKQSGIEDGRKISNREYNFRLAVPRDNNSEYGGRLRGKFMMCDLCSQSNSYDFSLQYIITKYRISWS